MNLPTQRAHFALPAAKNCPKRILSVDDDAAILFTRHKLLQAAGYEVVSVSDGEQALHFFDTYSPCIDLVLIDYDMPKMDGGALAQKIKRRRRQVPVIMVSGGAAPESISRCVDCFVQKGDGPESLLGEMRKLLESPLRKRIGEAGFEAYCRSYSKGRKAPMRAERVPAKVPRVPQG